MPPYHPNQPVYFSPSDALIVASELIQREISSSLLEQIAHEAIVDRPDGSYDVTLRVTRSDYQIPVLLSYNVTPNGAILYQEPPDSIKIPPSGRYAA